MTTTDSLSRFDPPSRTPEFDAIENPALQRALLRAAAARGGRVVSLPVPMEEEAGWLMVPHKRWGAVQVAYHGLRAWGL